MPFNPNHEIDRDKFCEWKEEEDGNYETRCGDMFILLEGTPKQNGINYCCYCGRGLIENLHRGHNDKP